jgi:hypothetical protein
MRILFDLEIKFPGMFEKCKPEEQLALRTIRDYVYDRIVVLADEMDAEENEDDKPKSVVIYLMNKPKAIQPRGYSDALCDKINGCFNENDAKLLWESVDKALQSLLN